MKVTAYCRVSTDSEDQRNSLRNQELFFMEYISKTDWEYVPMYVDEGMSGTSTRKRERFNQMIADAHEGKFDIILTKEVSRFSRNTVDTLNYTRKLKELGVGVIFINDNIDTRVGSDEFRLTIMASVAQEEVRKVSERVRWGQSRSMEKGVVFGQKILGYGRTAEKSLEIIPNEAAVVQVIFEKYLGGRGLCAIARELEQENILTAYKKTQWDATAVRRILTNEKYCGDLKQKKFITPNYLTHKTKRNRGEEDFVVVEDNHEAIICREIFEKTQKEIARRGAKIKEGTRYTARYVFSGKLICGCGARLVNRNSKTCKRWRCSRAMKYGSGENGCSAKTVPEKTLNKALLHVLSDLICDKDKLIAECMDLVSFVADAGKTHVIDLQNEIKKIGSRIERLIELRLDGEISKEEFLAKREPLDKHAAMLKERFLQNGADALSERGEVLGVIKNRVSEIIYAKIFSEEVVKEILEKIVVRDYFEIYFKGLRQTFSRSGKFDKIV